MYGVIWRESALPEMVWRQDCFLREHGWNILERVPGCEAVWIHNDGMVLAESLAIKYICKKLKLRPL